MVTRALHRSVKLPPFRCDKAAFDTLLRELRVYFDREEGVDARIEVAIDREELTFDALSEFFEYEFGCDRLSTISIHLSAAGNQMRIGLHAGTSLEPRAVISATSDNEGWNAGASEIALAFARRHRRWYPASEMLTRVPLFVACIAGWVAASRFYAIPPTSLPLLVVFASLALLSGFYSASINDKLFPAAVIVVRARENLLRQYAPEITVALMLATFLVTLCAWLSPLAR